ncbi:MAG: hypothetical protein IT269_07035 [Saprospiraceae bacterium]|nr:hypothetical protein [Saprospiraceae bacterium]
MTKFLLFPLSLAMLFFSCQKSDPNPDTSNNCLPGTFSKRLKKEVLSANHPGTGFNPTIYTTEYAYTPDGNLDEIRENNTTTKIMYRPDGKVDQLIIRSDDNPNYYTQQTYTYQNGQIQQTTSQSYNLNGTPTNQPLRYFYEWGTDGFLKKGKFENGNDETVFTTDGCGNIVKTQDFYLQNGAEHFLSKSEYAETPNPHYLIGLYKLYPEAYSVHNQIFGQIVHWDCADYDGSPITTQYIYDDEGLPVKSWNTNHTIEYFYE